MALIDDSASWKQNQDQVGAVGAQPLDAAGSAFADDDALRWSWSSTAASEDPQSVAVAETTADTTVQEGLGSDWMCQQAWTAQKPHKLYINLFT